MELGKQERMKLVHETVIERCKIFETLRACFLEPFKEKHLCARVQLLKEMAQLSHGVTASRDTEDVMHEALDELLSEILASEVAVREFP